MSDPTPDLTGEQVIEEHRRTLIWIILEGSPITLHRRDEMDTVKANHILDKLLAKLHSLGLIHSPSEIRVLERAATERVLKELRGKVMIERKESIAEAKNRPFDSDNLNDEHKIIWNSHASALNEVIAEIDRMLKVLALKSELLGEQGK